MQTRYLTKDKNRMNSIYDLFRLFKFRCFETILYKSKQNSIKKDKKTKEGIKRAVPISSMLSRGPTHWLKLAFPKYYRPRNTRLLMAPRL